MWESNIVAFFKLQTMLSYLPSMPMHDVCMYACHEQLCMSMQGVCMHVLTCYNMPMHMDIVCMSDISSYVCLEGRDTIVQKACVTKSIWGRDWVQRCNEQG